MPAAGEVRWNGSAFDRSAREYFGAVAYLGHQNAVKDELTAIEKPAHLERGLRSCLDKKEALEILKRVGLTQQQNLPARVLSAGQRRRLAMTRLLTFDGEALDSR